MFCRFCGQNLTEDSRFCPSCGHAVEQISSTENNADAIIEPAFTVEPTPTYTQTAQPTQQNNAPKKLQVMGLVGFILSCFSFLIFFSDLGLVATAGMIVSLVALSQYNKNPNVYKFKGFAIAGVAVGAVGAFIMLILMLAVGCTTCALLYSLY